MPLKVAPSLTKTANGQDLYVAAGGSTGGGGVSSVNSLTGAVGITGSTGISVAVDGQNIVVASSNTAGQTQAPARQTLAVSRVNGATTSGSHALDLFTFTYPAVPAGQTIPPVYQVSGTIALQWSGVGGVTGAGLPPNPPPGPGSAVSYVFNPALRSNAPDGVVQYLNAGDSMPLSTIVGAANDAGTDGALCMNVNTLFVGNVAGGSFTLSIGSPPIGGVSAFTLASLRVLGDDYAPPSGSSAYFGPHPTQMTTILLN